MTYGYAVYQDGADYKLKVTESTSGNTFDVPIDADDVKTLTYTAYDSGVTFETDEETMQISAVGTPDDPREVNYLAVKSDATCLSKIEAYVAANPEVLE